VARAGRASHPVRPYGVPEVRLEGMIERLRADAFVQICAILGIVTSFGAFVSSKEAVVALGVAGIIYSTASAILCLREAFFHRTSVFRGVVLIWAGVSCVLIAVEGVVNGRLIPNWKSRYADIHSFSLLQVFGIVGIALGIMLLSNEVEKRHRNRVQVCPDCLSECPAGAHVCRYCGYRWPEPPVGVPATPSSSVVVAEPARRSCAGGDDAECLGVPQSSQRGKG